MERLPDDLIGNVRTIIIAGVQVVHARLNRVAQNPEGLFAIARWSPHPRTRQLHRAIAHTVNRHARVREREASAEIGLPGHLPAPLLCSKLSWFNSK